jgi:hypothetical protein
MENTITLPIILEPLTFHIHTREKGYLTEDTWDWVEIYVKSQLALATQLAIDFNNCYPYEGTRQYQRYKEAFEEHREKTISKLRQWIIKLNKEFFRKAQAGELEFHKSSILCNQVWDDLELFTNNIIEMVQGWDTAQE